MFKDYIAKLLWEYDCVIIPDFGGFVAKVASARIHPTQHTFEPPYKHVAFNKNLNANDGLLANFVMKEQGISYSEANAWIEQEVRRMEIRLAQKEVVEIARVGSFYYDIERNLQFKFDENVNYLFDSFGLSSFQSPAIKRENYTERIEKQFIDRAAVPNPIKRKNFKKLWPVALALPVLIALFWIPLKSNLLGDVKASYSNLNPFSSAEPAAYQQIEHAFNLVIPGKKTITPLQEGNSSLTYINVGTDSTYFIPVKMDKVEADESPVLEQIQTPPTVQEVVAEQPAASGKYFLIAGCFKEKQNADALVEELKAKGFAASIAGQNSSGLYRVSFHSFDSKQAAEAAKTELALEHPGVWLYRN